MNIIKRYAPEALIGISAGVLNGLFGSGAGTLVVFAMERFLGTEPKKAHSSAVLIVLMMSAASAFLYAKSGYFSLKPWLFVSIGGAFGGMLGAYLLSKLSVKYLKKLFGVLILVAAYKMIF